MNEDKIILDLCGGTGAWSKPYKEAGYTVFNITLPDYDVRNWRNIAEVNEASGEIYGILAAPPCTMFSLARTRAVKPRDFGEGLEVVAACLDIIWSIRKRHKLAFWAMENPMGYLRQFIGKPPFTFDPWEFGDPWTKKTDIWGYYNLPVKKYTDMTQVMTQEQIDRCKTNLRILPSITDLLRSRQQARRAMTPQGFANAFYKANK